MADHNRSLNPSRHSGDGIAHSAVQHVTERVGNQRVPPKIGIDEHRHDLVPEPAFQVVADGPTVIVDLGQVGHRRAACDPAE